MKPAGEPSTIRIAAWNCRGYKSSVPFLRQLLKANDIVAISEHWLHQNRLSLLNEVSSDFNHCARSSKFSSDDNYGIKRGQGGVALFWNKQYSGVSAISDIKHDRICGVRFETKGGLVLNIFSIYLPSMGSPEGYDESLDDLAEIIETREVGSMSIICGDANSDLGNSGGYRGSKPATTRGTRLFDFMSKYDLVAANMTHNSKGPIITHEGPTGCSTLDYIMFPSSLMDKVHDIKVVGYDPLNCSDHFPVVASLDIDQLLYKYSTALNAKQNKRWDRLDASEMYNNYTVPLIEPLSNLCTSMKATHSTSDLDDVLEKVVEALKVADKAIPSTKFKAHLKPYWNQHLTLLKRDKVCKYKAWVSAGRPRNSESMVWILHKEAKKAFSRELRRLHHEYDAQRVNEAISSVGLDKVYFWKLLKSARSSGNKHSISIKDESKKVRHEVGEVLEVWRKHFQRLCTPKNDDTFDSEHFSTVNDKTKDFNNMTDLGPFLEQPFNYDEIRKALKRLHKRKASGVDEISAEHLIHAGEAMVKFLTLCFNKIAELEYIPKNFRRGVQIPLFKGKNLSSLDTNNYRGITLLTNFNKIFEIVLWQIWKYGGSNQA